MAKKQNPGTSADRVYKRIELIGISAKSYEAAIENAISRAGETLSGLRWFEVKELRGAIEGNRIAEYQVIITVSFEVK